jgi:phosphoribosyl-ATP pyrophosphohydrolase/phosphoribosyl-AMP cyclohydrolase
MTANKLAFLADLEQVIRDRIDNPSQDSYTASLVAQGATRVAQKVGEEGVELALAAVSGSKNDVLNETADLIYHVLVLLSARDQTLGDVVSVLEARHTSRPASP